MRTPYASGKRNLRTKIRKCVPTKRNREMNDAFQNAHLPPGSSNSFSEIKRCSQTMSAFLSQYPHASNDRLPRLILIRLAFCVRWTAGFVCVIYAEICVNATPGWWSDWVKAIPHCRAHPPALPGSSGETWSSRTTWRCPISDCLLHFEVCWSAAVDGGFAAGKNGVCKKEG